MPSLNLAVFDSKLERDISAAQIAKEVDMDKVQYILKLKVIWNKNNFFIKEALKIIIFMVMALFIGQAQKSFNIQVALKEDLKMAEESNLIVQARKYIMEPFEKTFEKEEVKNSWMIFELIRESSQAIRNMDLEWLLTVKAGSISVALKTIACVEWASTATQMEIDMKGFLVIINTMARAPTMRGIPLLVNM
mmetsp:Transcript_11739/g.17635  ORF Transcript_11739/g.17635 Transcript_11739/m.17635 type:complete len:192 (-) Transcript_11739:1512-2087(-)